MNRRVPTFTPFRLVSVLALLATAMSIPGLAAAQTSGSGPGRIVQTPSGPGGGFKLRPPPGKGLIWERPEDEERVIRWLLDGGSACQAGSCDPPVRRKPMEGLLQGRSKEDQGQPRGCTSGEVSGVNDKDAPVCAAASSKEAEQAAEEALVAGMALLIRRYDLPVALEPLKRGGQPISESLAKTTASTKRQR